MNFLKTIKESIYSPAFYTQLLKNSLGSAIRYYALLVLLLVTAQLLLMLPGLLTLQKEVPNFIQSAVGYYPQELVVKIKNGQVSSNVKEPYMILLPQQMKDSQEPIKNLLVIDTKTPFSAATFNSYNTAAWLTKNSIIYKKDSANFETTDLTNVKDFTLNKKFVQEIGEKVMPWTKFLLPAALLLAFIVLYVVYTLRAVYFLLLALGILGLLSFLKHKITYKQAAVITLHAITLGILLETTFQIISPFVQIPTVPFLLTITTLVLVYLNFKSVVVKKAP